MIKVFAYVVPKVGSLNDLLLKVRVSDNGIGMSLNDLNKVFIGQDSQTAESRRLNPYGNGIGLSFCKQVCQSLEGDIVAQSELGIGSSFTFTMKVMRAYSHETRELMNTLNNR